MDGRAGRDGGSSGHLPRPSRVARRAGRRGAVHRDRCVPQLLLPRTLLHNRNKKYFQKILRYLSLANWLFFVFLILSCEGVRIHIFGGARVTEWAFVGAMCFSWLVMMIESYVSRERWYIKHLGKRQDVLERIEKLKATESKIMWSVVGYNIETRDVPVRAVKLPCTTPTVKFEDSKVQRTIILYLNKVNDF